MSHQPDLMELLVFTEEDLALNRQGKLSAAQQSRLKIKHKIMISRKVLGILFLVFGCGLFPLSLMASPADGLWWFAFWVGFAMLAFYLDLYRRDMQGPIQTWQQIETGTVQVAEGLLITSVDRDLEGGIAYYLDIQNIHFRINKELYHLLQNGMAYRVYYFRFSRRNRSLLAAEPVSEVHPS